MQELIYGSQSSMLIPKFSYKPAVVLSAASSTSYKPLPKPVGTGVSTVYSGGGNRRGNGNSYNRYKPYKDSWDYFIHENQLYNDPAVAQTPSQWTKQDWAVGLGITTGVFSLGTIYEYAIAGAAIKTFIAPTLALANSIDEALTNPAGESKSLRMTNNPQLKKSIKIVKGTLSILGVTSTIAQPLQTFKSFPRTFGVASDFYSTYLFVNDQNK